MFVRLSLPLLTVCRIILPVYRIILHQCLPDYPVCRIILHDGAIRQTLLVFPGCCHMEIFEKIFLGAGPQPPISLSPRGLN